LTEVVTGKSQAKYGKSGQLEPTHQQLKLLGAYELL